MPQSQMLRRTAAKIQKSRPVRSMGANSRASWSVSDFSTPCSFRQIDHLRLRAQLLEEPERPRTLGQPGNAAPGIVEVAEDHGLGGTGLDAGGLVVALAERAILGAGLVLGLLEPVMAEGAFLDDALRADRDVGAQSLLHRLGPLGPLPVEVAYRIRTRGRAVAAADATRVDLRHEPLVVDLRGLDRADLRARRLLAVHAGQGHEPEVGARPVFVPPFLEWHEPHPRDRPAELRLVGPPGRYVVLDLARDDACLACRAAVEIDEHSPARHRSAPFGRPGHSGRRRQRHAYGRRA